MPIEDNNLKLDIPIHTDELLSPQWLQRALAEFSGGASITHVEIVDTLETMAAKVRFLVRFAADERSHHFCLKAFVSPALIERAGATAIREALFYQRIAPHVRMRVPQTISHIDREHNRAVLLMEDLIHVGAHFCSALEPFTVELAAQSLEQIARLHAATQLVNENDWLPSRLNFLATAPHFDDAQLQELMDGPRCAKLSRRTASASLLNNGMKKLAERFSNHMSTLLHGDCHAGNFYLTNQGPGLTDWQLIQRGHWAQDVAYHIAAILPEEIAAREERALVAHYLERVRAHGGLSISLDEAWDDYRAAQIYGYYHWAITTRVEPEIVNIFMQRLGAGIERHDTYAVLGL